MSVIKANGAGEVSTGFYNHEIEKSARFNDSSTHHLDKTPSSSGDSLTTWSWSAWIKRGDFGSFNTLWSANSNSNQIGLSSDRMYFEYFDGTNNNFIVGTKKLRDVSAWYHLLFVWDTSNATTADRMRMYCNSERITEFASSSLPTQNRASIFNTAVKHEIARRVNPDGVNYDGYLTEINFIDGQALDPDSFGEDKEGVWIPKDTSGLTFGTNGYRLEFKQTGTSANSSGMGADTSGNDNHYNPVNMNSTISTGPDTPTNNFSVLNPIVGKALTSFVDPRHGNLKIDTPNSGRGTTFSTLIMSPGTGSKYYAEFYYAADSGHMRCGVISTTLAAQYRETNTFDTSVGGIATAASYTSVTGGILVNGSSVATVATYTTGDVIGVALDLENGIVEFFKNGTSVHSETNSIFTSDSYLFAAGDSSNSNDIRYNANFGQDSTFANEETAQSNTDASGLGTFQHSVPSGHKALCAKNLLEPSISPLNGERPNEYFDVALYSGNGSSQSISDYQFSPDWVWIKERSSTSSYMIYDVLRGTDVFMQSNSTVKDTSSTVNLTSFDSNGFSVGSGGATNQSSQTYVAWAWLAGTTFSGTTNGGKAYSGQSNSKAGFSIVTYVGNEQSGHEIPHNLSAAPDMVVAKSRGHDDHWDIFHKGIATDAETDFIRWNSTNGASDASSVWNDTAPTASVVTLGNTDDVNKNNTDHIMYVFHNVEGYSRFGHYTGNGSSDGQYVYTGFRPAYVLIKESSDNGNNWNVHDYKRDPYNVGSNRLRISRDNDTEDTGTFIDLLSNGFKLRLSGTAYNGNGDTYIYMAFAEMPAKYANAR